jgi:hypothetical protein
MGEADKSLQQLARYGRVATHSQILMVMEPPHPGEQSVEVARRTIVDEAVDYLEEVEKGVASPYFTIHTPEDSQVIVDLAVNKVRESAVDRPGVFLMDPKIHSADPLPSQTAKFAYSASNYIQQVKVPFPLVPGLRTRVRGPRNLSEFLETVKKVKDVTYQTQDEESFFEVRKSNDWRVAFAFWEANRWLAQAIYSV